MIKLFSQRLIARVLHEPGTEKKTVSSQDTACETGKRLLPDAPIRLHFSLCFEAACPEEDDHQEPQS